MKSLLLAITLLGLISTRCFAVDSSPECFRRLERTFFISNNTQQAFSLHNVPQSSWILIYNQLLRAAERIPQVVRARAERLRVNPLKRPFDPDKSWEILEQVLFEVFQEVLRANNAFFEYNDHDIKEMFEFIKQQHTAEIKACNIKGL